MTDSIIDQAIALVRDANGVGLELRLLGSVAVTIVTGSDTEARPAAIKDIDVISARLQQARVQDFLGQRGWEVVSDLLLLSESRETYFSKAHHFSIDLYYDGISGNHWLGLEKRLTLSYPTITAIDLILSKLQRCRQRPQDRWDLDALLGEQLSRDDFAYFQHKVCGDWGLWMTATQNLIESLASHRQFLCANRERLLREALLGPKTFSWILRSLIGKRLKWWSDMYDTEIRAREDN